ncbi:MAG: SMP-30/gluconolactonase/LRE family protein [Bryobacteraceae bacterium]
MLFGPDVVLPNSYLNDVRIDNGRKVAYITDSGAGGIVVVDLNSARAHRTLDGHPSVKAEQGVGITINGKPVLAANGKPPMFNSDGIALSPDGEYLYYQALTGATLYRVKTNVLRDANARPETVGAAVEKVAKTFPVDGLWMDSQRRLYLSGLTQNAVMRLLPDGKMETVAVDPRLQWPDTFSEGPDGSIYISASHINESPTYNNGKSVRKQPYAVFKLKP